MASSKFTKSPAFQWYPKDFISSTKVQRMSLSEIGAYILLLSHCWLDGGLPTDLKQLARIVKVKAQQFVRMWEAGPLSECFYEKNGRLQNKRLDDERRKQIAFHQRQSENGKKGGRPLSSGLSQKEPTGNPPLSPRVGDRKEETANSSTPKKENDVAFAEFRDAYPGPRRKGGYLVEQDYLKAVADIGGHAALMAVLANHKASEQWTNPRMIPGMDLWFREERWRQTLPAAQAIAGAVKHRYSDWTPRPVTK